MVPGTSFSPYTYTSFGYWDGKTGSIDGTETHQEGIFAYGVPTASTGVPTSGSATYTATVVGRTADGYDIGGNATLQFQFAAGTLSGHFDPLYYDWDAVISLGRYDFVNTAYAAGSTTFAGGLSQGGVGTGSFNGEFTGPNSEELMARWLATYHNAAQNTDLPLSGIWVGKKN